MFKHLVFGLCGYECVAIYSHKKVPTLSELTRRHHWIGPVLVGGLSVHLYRHAKVVPFQV
jgi:hypothetical protein